MERTTTGQLLNGTHDHWSALKWNARVLRTGSDKNGPTYGQCLSPPQRFPGIFHGEPAGEEVRAIIILEDW